MNMKRYFGCQMGTFLRAFTFFPTKNISLVHQIISQTVTCETRTKPNVPYLIWCVSWRTKRIKYPMGYILKTKIHEYEPETRPDAGEIIFNNELSSNFAFMDWQILKNLSHYILNKITLVRWISHLNPKREAPYTLHCTFSLLKSRSSSPICQLLSSCQAPTPEHSRIGPSFRFADHRFWGEQAK